VSFKKFLENAYQNKSGETFWGNVGAGILPIAISTSRILVAHRSAYVNEPNTYGIWGGKVDNEHTINLEQEAKREFKEETGYSGSIRLMKAAVFKTKGFEYHNFLGIIPSEFEPSYNWETQDSLWITLDELFDLEPKHFGLKYLLNNSYSLIKKYTNQ
jgi:8-oxo-dGTP pyrophosphatase MutT (NUDIX family)